VLTQSQHHVNPINQLNARFDNFIHFTPLPIHFQLNLNSNTEQVNSFTVFTTGRAKN